MDALHCQYYLTFLTFLVDVSTLGGVHTSYYMCAKSVDVSILGSEHINLSKVSAIGGIHVYDKCIPYRDVSALGDFHDNLNESRYI